MRIFKETFKTDRKILIPYLTVGAPSLEQTEKIASAMIEEGAQILELGVPFSDPSADGVVLQAAAEVALRSNVTLQDVLSLAKGIHLKYPHVGLVLFTYLNPLLSLGLAQYVRLAKESGIAATLTVDLPVEEADEYIRLHQSSELGIVFLAAPTTSLERLKKIQSASTAFLYYVSRNGVTGEQSILSKTLENEVRGIKQSIHPPVAIGFGISDPAQAKVVARYADAVVIGSAYMRMILEAPDEFSREREVREFTRSCISSMNSSDF